MAKYRLLKGSYTSGQRGTRKTYNHADPTRNVVESSENLAALDPQKFQAIDEGQPIYQYDPNRKAGRGEGDGPKPNAMPALTPTTSKQVERTGTIEERYGSFDGMTVNDLKEVAEAEEVDIKGHTKKEDIVKALRAVK